ncbi:MAG TPA: alpha/beta fold hydrolase [Candidatus Binatia bacterium]|nr:alpha/beta fold hydrolase [Candidatus Binatia bacterium]
MPTERVGDIELYYELHDFCEPWRAGRLPIIFIHGLGGSHAMWLYQVPAFCDAFPVITVDLRAHGASGGGNADFTIADMARDLVRLMRTQGIERAHLVGLSLGGMVAQQFALDYPLAVGRLVLADTFAGTPPGFADVMRNAFKFIEDNPMRAVAQSRISNAFSDRVDPVMRDYFIDQVSRNDKAAYVRAARAAFGFDARDRLSEIAAPTLVIVGDEDRVTPPFCSEEIADGIRSAQLVRIPRGGHITNIEFPREFNAAVREFLLAR